MVYGVRQSLRLLVNLAKHGVGKLAFLAAHLVDHRVSQTP
jgi:hypothetical protein